MNASDYTVLPNLIIPGAQKSASTTLFSLLAAHEDIYAGEKKEPHFFSRDKAYSQGANDYSSNYMTHRGQKIIMDSSQSYLPLPIVPERIYKTLGNQVRFILLLRNPVDRAVSAFVHEKTRPGRDSKRQLSDLVPAQLEDITLDGLLTYERQEIERGLAAGIIQPRDETWMKFYFPYRYFWGSCYARHISNYLNLFPKEHFLFLTFEEVTQNQRMVVDKMAAFLGIEPAGFDISESNVRINRSLEYKSRLLLYLLRPFKLRIRHLLPPGTRKPLAALEAKWFQRKPNYRFSDDTYRYLLALFRPEITRTEQLTGLDLSKWQHVS